jgi:hypothetical protein
MERWLRGRSVPDERVAEPDTIETFPVERLTGLSVEVPANKGFAQIGRIYGACRGYKRPVLSGATDWQSYREQMLAALGNLLGRDARLPRQTTEPAELGKKVDGDLLVERVGYPSEGGILVPTIVLRQRDAAEKLPVVLLFAGAGREALLAERKPDSPSQLARQGSLVVLPDVRCHGQMLSTGSQNQDLQRKAWERNGIVWGRPVPGMACTDILGVLDGLSARTDADMSQVRAVTRNAGDLALAVLFAAALDKRIASMDLDLDHACFQKRNLQLVSGVLQFGDVLEWAALSADRRLVLRNVPPEAGQLEWLQKAFALMNNRDGLQIGGVH